MIVVTVFLSILNQMEFHLAKNRKENRHHNHIPFNVKGNGNIFFLSFQFERKCRCRRGGKRILMVGASQYAAKLNGHPKAIAVEETILVATAFVSHFHTLPAFFELILLSHFEYIYIYIYISYIHIYCAGRPIKSL